MPPYQVWRWNKYFNDSGKDGKVLVSNTFNTLFHKLNETFWGCIIANIWTLLLHFPFAFPFRYISKFNIWSFGPDLRKISNDWEKNQIYFGIFHWVKKMNSFLFEGSHLWCYICSVFSWYLLVLINKKDLLPWLWSLCWVASLLWRWQ